MSQTDSNQLAGEIAVYSGRGETRNGWRSVLAASAFTIGMFVLLPFTEILKTPAPKTLGLRQVDVTPPPLEAPRIIPITPPSPVRNEKPKPRNRPKPKLETPQRPQRPRLQLPVTLDVPRADFKGDFAVSLGGYLAPQGGLVATGPLETGFGTDLALDFALEPEPPPDDVVAMPEDTRSIFGVADLDRPPRPSLQVPPVYPYRARARNIEGHVDVGFTLTREGTVIDIEIVEAVPGETFVDAARRAVSRWRFEPGIRKGEPVAVRMQVKLRFKLK
ncbi:MAG: energy transducer TonB [Lentisphaerae bacterium]|jgi:TonB family protein|nr:energy transducer TonB [Lentisphaerota bacterium]MBT4823159.1 energy transducer TonB [Lentisphaerota bacterium]MBT5610453.1 energy transducer TonB [Lentisphaerota bacterium]MBT7061044.1 energy transducer TonB [Lentisphaerota bacterium]MBT7842171.1 energy transducer TonB [Lentisphaerota bacterium]